MKSNRIIFDVLSKKELENLITKSLNEAVKNNLPAPSGKEELLTRDQACALLKVDPSTLWRWTNKGTVTAYGIGSRRFYKKEELMNSLVVIKSKGRYEKY